MTTSSYLILTAKDQGDASRWGFTNNGKLIAVAPDGSVTHCAFPATFPQNTQRIVIVNMAPSDAFPYGAPADEQDLLARLKLMLGDVPRIWVHFGGRNCPDMTCQTIQDDWQNNLDYICFRKTFTDDCSECGPMPYSQTSRASWDMILKDNRDGLTMDVRVALEKSVSLDVAQWLPKLDSAWMMAGAQFKPQEMERARAAIATGEVLKSLLAVAIYCDGFSYALSTKQDGRIAAMRKIMFEEVPAVIATVNLTTLDQTSAKATIEDLQDALTKDLQTLAVRSKAFTDWYRATAKHLLNQVSC